VSELKELVEKAFLAIQRDIKNIVLESSSRKLSPASARDLVNYYKVLREDQRQQAKDDAELAKMTDDELKERIKSLLEGGVEGAGEADGEEEV
jgi:hypothetical protein